MDTAAHIRKHRIIVIVRGLQEKYMLKLAAALQGGGIRMMEVTYDQAEPGTFSETSRAIASIRREFAGGLTVGAGTVISAKQLDLACEAGAGFIVSPNTDADIIRRTKERGLVSLPGALTPTEILCAKQAGADFVKVFPAGNLGPAYIKAVKAPLSHVELIAVGGVNENNAADFIRAGAAGVGVGGNLVNKSWIMAGEYEKIRLLAAEYVRAVEGAQRP